MLLRITRSPSHKLGLSELWVLSSGLHGHLDTINGNPTHVLAAVSMTSILLVHVARHWKWVMATMRRYRALH